MNPDHAWLQSAGFEPHDTDRGILWKHPRVPDSHIREDGPRWRCQYAGNDPAHNGHDTAKEAGEELYALVESHRDQLNKALEWLYPLGM